MAAAGIPSLSQVSIVFLCEAVETVTIEIFCVTY